MNAAGRCPWCGALLHVVAVHGHGQCARCGTNVDPCCAGASAGDEADEPGATGAAPDPRLFRRLFAQLGDDGSTLTLDCVLHGLVRALDTDLDGARIVLDAAAGLGQVAVKDGTVRLVGSNGDAGR